MKLNKQILDALIADATDADCKVILEVTSQGAVLTLKKNTTVDGPAIGRQTTLMVWLDKGNPDVDHDITKAFASLP